MRTDGVQLVNKHHAGCCAAGLSEQVPDSCSPPPHKHLHKFRRARGEKGHASLTSHGFGCGQGWGFASGVMHAATTNDMHTQLPMIQKLCTTVRYCTILCWQTTTKTHAQHGGLVCTTATVLHAANHSSSRQGHIKIHAALRTYPGASFRCRVGRTAAPPRGSWRSDGHT